MLPHLKCRSGEELPVILPILKENKLKLKKGLFFLMFYFDLQACCSLTFSDFSRLSTLQ